MDYLHILRKQVTGLQSGDGPKHVASPSRMQTPSNNSKIPRFVNHGFSLSKQDMLSSKTPVPKRRFDDIPRLDIPLSPDTGDEATTTESTTTSTVLSPSQSGDGSLVTVDSWKSGSWPNSGQCLCRRTKSIPFSPKEVKEANGKCSKISVINANDEEYSAECINGCIQRNTSNEKLLEIDADVDEVTVRLDFKMNGRSTPFKTEVKEKHFIEETGNDDNEPEEITVSFGKPIGLKGTESEVNEEGSSLKGTESFTYTSELSNPNSVEKVSWPTFNNGNTINPEAAFAPPPPVKFQRSDLHARIRSMIDFGKSLLSSRNSERERSSCVTACSTFSNRGKCESESHLSTIKSIRNSNECREITNNLWTPSTKPENWTSFRDKISSKLSSPQLCLLNSAKFHSPSSSDDWYDTAEEVHENKNPPAHQEEELPPSPTPNSSETTTSDSDSAILLSTVGVQVDLIAWDLMGKEPAEVRDIGVQVNKNQKHPSTVGNPGFPVFKKASKKRTVYFDLSTPKMAVNGKPEMTNVYFDAKSDGDEKELLETSEDDSDHQTIDSHHGSSDKAKSPLSASPLKESMSKASFLLQDDSSTVSISDTTDSSKDEPTKRTEVDSYESKTQSEDTYTVDLASQWSTISRPVPAIPVAISSLTSDNKAKWLKDLKGRLTPQNGVPFVTPSKIPSSTKLVRDISKKASTSLTLVSNRQQPVARKFQSPQPGDRSRNGEEMKKVDQKGVQRFRPSGDVLSKKL